MRSLMRSEGDFEIAYQGWKNWETWNVALWCDNEEPIYRARMEAKPRTAEECETFVRDHFPSGTPDMRDDDSNPYCRAAVAVDWEEIASHWADDYGDDVAT